MKKIEQIYNNFHRLQEKIKESDGAIQAHDEMNNWIEHHDMSRKDKNKLYGHTINYAMWKEMQGFEQGFKYAVSLIMETV